MNRYKLMITNIVLLLVTLLFNGLSQLGIFNDLTNAEVSGMYQTKITPAGFAFSIWGLIYTLLIITMAWLFYKRENEKVGEVIDAMGYYFIIASVANIVWTVLFAYLQIGLSTIAIFILLLSLMQILMRFKKLDQKINPLYSVTFGMYAGWVLVATVVNIAAALVKVEWGGFGIDELVWATIIVVAAVVIAFYVTTRTTNTILPLPIAWAYFAIFKGEDLTVALVGMVLLIGMAIYQFYKNHYSFQETERV